MHRSNGAVMTNSSITAARPKRTPLSKALSQQDAAVPDDTFAELLTAHQDYVTRLTYRLLGWQEAEVPDVVQEVFLAAYRNWPKFRGQSTPATWLTRITVNKCRNFLRKKALRRWVLRPWQTEPPAPENTKANDDTLHHVRQTVQTLPAKLREVAILRYLEEHSAAETAKILGITENAVNIRMHRARAELKKRLTESLENHDHG